MNGISNTVSPYDLLINVCKAEGATFYFDMKEKK